MPTPDAAEKHYAAQLRQATAASLQAQEQWQQIGSDFDTGWSGIASRVALIVGSAQLGAARSGAAYIPAALGEIGQEAAIDGAVRPQGWAGVASDGRMLDSLLYSAVVHAKIAAGAGLSTRDALLAGQKNLNLIVQTQVADAGRGAAGVAIAARPRVGWTRMVASPCCQRCAVLAGKWFKWNTGFLRHPKCRCRHVPCEQQGFSGYTSKVEVGDVRDLTLDQRRAVADGANLNQVINAHRAGARSSDGMTTSEGVTRRGVYGGYRRNADGSLTRVQRGENVPARLTPEAVYRLAATREEALQRLKQNGYLL